MTTIAQNIGTILVQPEDLAEFQLLTGLFTRMKVATTMLSEEEWEDLGLSLLINEADRSDH